MSRISLPASFYSHPFAQLAKREKAARVRVRLLGMSLLQENKSLTEVGKLLKVRRMTVGEWLGRFLSEGFAGLHDIPRSGRHHFLSASQRQALIELISAEQGSRPGGRLRGSDITALIEREFGVSYANGSIYRVLKHLGMSWISARSQHPKANQEKQAAFKKTLENLS